MLYYTMMEDDKVEKTAQKSLNICKVASILDFQAFLSILSSHLTHHLSYGVASAASTQYNAPLAPSGGMNSSLAPNKGPTD
jgi:hypothetical protein